MSSWELPVAVEVAGRTFNIRSDFRAVLDIITAQNDPELSDREKALVTLQIMYPNWSEISDPEEALRKAMEFINLGEPVPENLPPKPQLVDWNKDFKMIAPAVDKVLGFSCRRAEYLHWWEFVGAYQEIGKCLFAEVTNIRNKRARGKPLEKWEQEFASANAEMVALESKITQAENEFLKSLGID